jgi:hypothetical protein
VPDDRAPRRAEDEPDWIETFNVHLRVMIVEPRPSLLLTKSIKNYLDRSGLV